jgi:hypothetical protein
MRVAPMRVTLRKLRQRRKPMAVVMQMQMQMGLESPRIVEMARPRPPSLRMLLTVTPHRPRPLTALEIARPKQRVRPLRVRVPTLSPPR